MRSHQDDIDGWIELDNALQNIHPGQFRHDEIGEHDVRMALQDEVKSFFRVRCGDDLHTFLRKSAGHQLDTSDVVIDYGDSNIAERSRPHLSILLRQ
jgi:hypothetical protein